ncbi:MAG: type II secretion system protein [Parachlamydiaceae bacterium]
MKKIHKRPFTLIEVIVALILATLIMSSLLFYYFQMSQISVLNERASVEGFKLRYLQNRLSDLTLKLIQPDNATTFFFTSTHEHLSLFLPGTANLIFSYRNDTTTDLALNGVVLARLYVDPEKKLTLMTWQDRSDWKEDSQPSFHQEILAEGVQELSMEFFVNAKTDLAQDQAASEELRLSKWLNHWRKEFKELPAIIRFKIVIDDQSVTYSLPLPHARVVYHT